MDTSETYIKMCEKAEEIQPKDCVGWIGGTHQDGNIYFHTSRNTFPSGFYYLMDEVTENECGEQCHRQIKAIWLPRQDQLQEMIGANCPLQLLLNLLRWCDVTDIAGYDDSMEQLWLAFVMKEKYNKIWNGEEWIQS
jgi:hypothetical protein